jgi:RHS repeat-associated protein
LCWGVVSLFMAAHAWMFRPSRAMAACDGTRAMGYPHRYGVSPLRGVCVQRLKRLKLINPNCFGIPNHPRRPDVGAGHVLSNDARPKANDRTHAMNVNEHLPPPTNTIFIIFTPLHHQPKLVPVSARHTGQPESYYHGEGRVALTGDKPAFQYKLTDHLGNTMVLFEDKDGDGIITTESNPAENEVLQRNFYYAFGLPMLVPYERSCCTLSRRHFVAVQGARRAQCGTLQPTSNAAQRQKGKTWVCKHFFHMALSPWNHTPTDPAMPYLYNGKELEGELGLGWYAYGFRYYDASVGRFVGVDPLADHANQIDKSPFAYAWGNPISLIDPDGLCPFCPLLIPFFTGFAIGAGADATVQVAANKVQGKGAFDDYSISSTFISGVFGGLTGGSSSAVRSGLLAAGESVSKQIITDGAVASSLRGDFTTIQENAMNVSAMQVVSDVALDNIGGNVKAVGDSEISVMERQLDRLTRINNANTRPARAQKVQQAQNTLTNAENSNRTAAGMASNGLQRVSDGTRSYLSVEGNSPGLYNESQVAQDNTRVNIALPIER